MVIASAFFLLFLLPNVFAAHRQQHHRHQLNRYSFPNDFVFGTASAAYQYEGAASEDGRKPSIWDTFSHTPGHIQDGSNGDVAEDQYHRYKEDILLMKNMGVDAYRFSISWSRIFPDGKGSEVNPAGVAYYNSLINGLLSQGIQPYVTLYHWDLPQALEDSIGGWLSSEIVDIFASYANACFQAFGDRVKNWITFNEPLSFVSAGYGRGTDAPGRCSTCPTGDSVNEPFIAAHNVLLSHAAAVKIYRNKYQNGRIGITLNTNWFEPYSNSTDDIQASRRALDFDLGWYLNPIVFKDYPSSMRSSVGSRLPKFTNEEISSLHGSIDFLGLNHYTSSYARAVTTPASNNISNYYQFSGVSATFARDGLLIGPQAASNWLYIVPWGFQKLVTYIAKHYNNPILIITENGVDEANDPSASLKASLRDRRRVKYYHDYLSHLRNAIRDGADVRGYFAWSLLDNFEWSNGYTVRFGLHFVDYKNNLKRYPKTSAIWFRKFLNHTC